MKLLIFLFCIKNFECNELIGSQKLIRQNGKDEIKFQSGFLYNSIKDGNCIVLDNINEAPSRVIGRLNGLLDKKIIRRKIILRFQNILKIQN